MIPFPPMPAPIHFTAPRQIPAPAVDIPKVIEVLIALESDGNWDRMGGALQFTACVWAEETNQPYAKARNREMAVMVAHARLRRICDLCARSGLRPTPELLIGSWHHGPFGAMWRVKHHRMSDYMIRGANLYATD